MITQTETLVALVTQLGLSSTTPLDKNLHAIGQLVPGSSVYIEPGDYFKYGGIKQFILSRTLPSDGPLTLSVFKHADGERTEMFTTTLPADRLEQATFNNGSSLPGIIEANAGDVWELFVPLDATGIAEGTAFQLTLMPY
jgi:hypothetical protein